MAQPELIKDIEARVKKSGDIMTGNLESPMFITDYLKTLNPADNNNPSFIHMDSNLNLLLYNKNNLGFTQLALLTNKFGLNALLFYYKLDTDTNYSQYTIIHTGNLNLITPLSIGALPISGGTLTGPILNFNNGNGLIYNLDDSTNRLFMFRNVFDSNNWSGLLIESPLNKTDLPRVNFYLTINGTLKHIGTILHTGNRASYLFGAYHILNGTDFNTILTPGYYSSSWAHGCTNYPSTNQSAGMEWALMVVNARMSTTDTGWTWQTAYPAYGDRIFHRYKNGLDVWSSWRTILDSNNFSEYALPLTGGTITGTLKMSTHYGIYARHIDGSLDGFSGELYLNYNNNAAIILGHGGGHYISANGAYYSGTSNASNYLLSLGIITALNGTARYPTGLRIGRVYSSGYPFSYGTTLTMEDGGFGAELIFNGLGGGGATGSGSVYFRTHSDWTNSEWGEWKHLWQEGDLVTGAVWNDYAEYRKAESIEPGRVVIESADGEMKLSTERLQPGAEIISDTFGFAIGETDEYKTPIAATGRVLAYPNEDRYSYPLGCAVCSGPNGTVSQMTREEIREYPERIIGTVSEIPEYKTWGTGNVEVNGRIWIRIK